MTHAATTDDPLRAEVEAALRRVVTDVVTLPCQVARAAGDRLARPVGLARSMVSMVTGGLLGGAAGSPQSVPAPTADASADGRRAGDAPSPVQPVRSHGPVVVSRDRPALAPDAGDLPIDEYESLAASQVVARLERLDPSDLRRIADFETAHRGRRTVLGKIDQLLAARP